LRTTAHFSPEHLQLTVYLGWRAGRPVELIDRLMATRVIRSVSTKSTPTGTALVLVLTPNPHYNPYGTLALLADAIAKIAPEHRAIRDPWRAPEPVDVDSATNLIGEVFRRHARRARTR
jgi:hypothetical protein